MINFLISAVYIPLIRVHGWSPQFYSDLLERPSSLTPASIETLQKAVEASRSNVTRRR
jgi:hypothetical protein